MLSQMAKEDVAALLAEGITPSFEQLVTLNALGLLVERGPFAGVVFSAPRVAWAGTVPIFEPTIQSEQWYLGKAMDWWSGKSLFWALAWACAHSTVEGFFESMTVEEVRVGWFRKWRTRRRERLIEKNARKAIQQWGNSLPCTPAQLTAALDFAITGQDVTPIASDSPSGELESLAACPHTGLIDDALAAGLGLSPERIAAMPRRRVMSILRKWAENQIAMGGGKADIDKGSKTDAYVQYDDYLIEIRNGRLQIYG